MNRESQGLKERKKERKEEKGKRERKRKKSETGKIKSNVGIRQIFK